MTVRLPVRLAVGRRVYDLGVIDGETADQLTDHLADTVVQLAALLRPDATPADPCEACGVQLVYRRRHTGRYVPLARDPQTGDVSVYGVHYPGQCVHDHDAAAAARGASDER